MQNPVNGKTLPAWALRAMRLERSAKLEVLRSASGYYIGTLTAEGLPNFRISVEYWLTRTQAEAALSSGHWAVKVNP